MKGRIVTGGEFPKNYDHEGLRSVFRSHLDI